MILILNRALLVSSLLFVLAASYPLTDNQATSASDLDEYLNKKYQQLQKQNYLSKVEQLGGPRYDASSEEVESEGEWTAPGPFNRERRRDAVFKNIYQRCRIQKRKEKDLCLYLAYLYQNVKGIHAL